MLKSRCVVWTYSLFMALGTVTVSGVALGQSYPDKPVRMVAAEPGGSSDLAARLLAQNVSLGQPVVVENRPGIIAIESVAKGAPGGYIMLLYGAVTWIEPLMRSTAAWDPIRDLSPITAVAVSPNILVVHPSLPVKTVKDLIALAKARPGQLNYGTTSPGSTNYLGAALFKAMAGIDVVQVLYRGTPQAISDLIAGHVQFEFPSAGPAIPHLKSGRLRALGVTSTEPYSQLPNVPTVAASGLPGYESVATYAIFVPAKTSAAVIDKLNQEFVRAIHKPDVKEKFIALGMEPRGSTAEQMATIIKSEMARMGKVIKDAGLRLE